MPFRRLSSRYRHRPGEQKKVFATYKQTNCKVLLYDYPLTAGKCGKKRTIRESTSNCCPPTVSLSENDLADYYKATILVTGAGGSIGSDLCRQLAWRRPSSCAAGLRKAACTMCTGACCRHTPGLDIRNKIASICDPSVLETLTSTPEMCSTLPRINTCPNEHMREAIVTMCSAPGT